MLSGVSALFNNSLTRFFILAFLPSTIIGFLVFPNASVFLIEEEPFSFGQSNYSEVNEEEFVTLNTSCGECHPDVYAEIQSTPHHKGFDCGVCHIGMSKNVSCNGCHNVSQFDAHLSLIEQSIENSFMNSSNEACVACHTSATLFYNTTSEKKIIFSFDYRN